MKVSIHLDPGETPEQADEELQKALDVKNSADHRELYEDDLANEMLDKINEEAKDIFRAMFKDIGEVIARDIYGPK